MITDFNLTTKEFISSSWIMSINDLNVWVDNLQKTDNQNLAVGFCSLKRWLTEHVEERETFVNSLLLMDKFLEKIEGLILYQDLSDEMLCTLFGILMTTIAEVGPYRYETKKDEDGEIWRNILEPMEKIRIRAVGVCKLLFSRPEFDLLQKSIKEEIFPLLDVAIEIHGEEHDQYMPFRVIQIGKIAERLYELAGWLEVEDPHRNPEIEHLVKLLQKFFNLKYPRFGTSGLRGRWDVDFTEIKARRTGQAICQYLADCDIPDYVIPKAKPLTGKWIVIGYDGRRNSQKVANWLAEAALGNGFPVYMCSRPTPTPVIAFAATKVIGEDNIAGIINCTASHNPADWQGIKFNPNQGYPASTHLTDIIASRINEMQLLNIGSSVETIESAEADGRYKYIDPISKYWEWIKQNGVGNQRIPINFDNIREYFKDKHIIIDEMHGAGRGYMGVLLGYLGIPHTLFHSEYDPDMGELDYANPELPYIQPLIDVVRNEGADLGLGLDTDADRFGVVDKGGHYFRPNQILAMLAYYLGFDRKLQGRIVITQTGLPMIEAIAENFPNIERPEKNVIPPYVDHAFYKRRVGNRDDMVFENVFVVPVGIKYIVEVARMDTQYRLIPEEKLGDSWMDNLLLGGEESSGLTTRGHVPDKDGPWADLLVIDMISYYKKPLAEIWKYVSASKNAWESFGGRVDVDASDRAKERLISYYLDTYREAKPGEEMLAGFPILYVGGIRYDMVEIFLGDKDGKMKNFLRIRASGTEPINRVYAETSDPELWKELQGTVLSKLDEYSIDEIRKAYRIQRLADIVINTKPFSWTKVLMAVREKLTTEGWDVIDLKKYLSGKRDHVENRNREILDEWLMLLS